MNATLLACALAAGQYVPPDPDLNRFRAEMEHYRRQQEAEHERKNPPARKLKARVDAAMSRAGFEEVTFSQLATADDGRLWRDVPGRRWWARAGDRAEVVQHTAREVVLVHRLA